MNHDEYEMVQEPLARTAAAACGAQLWDGAQLPREHRDVVVAEWLVEAVDRLNPDVDADARRRAVDNYLAVVATVTVDNLVERAQELLGMLRSGVQVRCGGRLRSVHLADWDDPAANQWDVACEVTYDSPFSRRAARFDVVVYCNGIPLVVAETKSPTSPTTSWLDAASELAETYTERAPGVLAAGVVLIATEGRELRYGPVGAPAHEYQRWGATGRERTGGIDGVLADADELCSPRRLRDWVRDYVLHGTGRSTGHAVRLVPRWVQDEAAGLVAHRIVHEPELRALVAHFQGSGKTMSMLMAANRVLRERPKSCVVVVVDRLDLLDQHRGEFVSSDARVKVTEADSGEELEALLRAKGTNGIIMTTVQRFRTAGVLTERSDVAVLVDEAHRTQEGRYGHQMRTALPNATIVGFTGTPVASGSRDTFETFGSDTDEGRVLHQYTAADSIEDGTTLELVVQRNQLSQTLDRDALDAAYEEYLDAQGIDEFDAEVLADGVTATAELLRDPRRVQLVADTVAEDMRTRVLPAGYGGLLVTVDRIAAVTYAEKLKALLGDDVVTAVISESKNDPVAFEAYHRSAAEQHQVVRRYLRRDEPLKLLVVCAKLLTGFDAPNCSTVYIDRPLRDHTLFQTAARTNRLHSVDGTVKTHGTVVDFYGVADQLETGLDAGRGRRAVVSDRDEIARRFDAALDAALALLGGVDLDQPRSETVAAAVRDLHADAELAQRCRDAVAATELLYQASGHHPAVLARRDEMLWAVAVLCAFEGDGGSLRQLLMRTHGPAVRALLAQHTGDPESAGGATFTVDAERARDTLAAPQRTKAYPVAVADKLRELRRRFAEQLSGADAEAYRSIADKLDQFEGSTYTDGDEAAALAELDAIEAQFDAIAGGGTPRSEALGRLDEVLQRCHDGTPPVTCDELAQIAELVAGQSSYHQLRDGAGHRRQLRARLARTVLERGLMPDDGAPELVEALVGYVEEWAAS